MTSSVGHGDGKDIALFELRELAKELKEEEIRFKFLKIADDLEKQREPSVDQLLLDERDVKENETIWPQWIGSGLEYSVHHRYLQKKYKDILTRPLNINFTSCHFKALFVLILSLGAAATLVLLLGAVLNVTKIINDDPFIPLFKSADDPYIVHTKYDESRINNESLFKHHHEKDSIQLCRDNFRVLYLCQGRSIFELPDIYTLFYENDNNYMIFLYYDESIYNRDIAKLSQLLSRVNKDKFKLLIIAAFKTSFAEGRNILLSYSFKYEPIMLNNKCNFHYVCLIDEDIQFTKFDEPNMNKTNTLNVTDYNSILNDFYFNFLNKHRPFIGIPHRIGGGFVSVKTSNIPQQYKNYKYLKLSAFDPMIAYYYRPLLNNNLLFPLYTKYDTQCWWISGWIQSFKINMLFPFELYNASIMYMSTLAFNPEHSNYPKGCGGSTGAPRKIYTQFSQYISKYLGLNTSIHCEYDKFRLWRNKNHRVSDHFLSEISIQRFNYTKNDPSHYLDDFTLCDV